MPYPRRKMITHYSFSEQRLPVCDERDTGDGLFSTTDPGLVTCFRCRSTESFKATQTTVPMRLREVMAESPEFQALAKGVEAATPHTPPYMNDYDDGVFRFHGTHSDIHGEMEVIPMTTGNVEFEIRDNDSGQGMVFNLSHLDRMDLVRALLHDFHYSPETGGPSDD